MQYFKDEANNIFAYDDVCDPSYIQDGLCAITEDDAMQHVSPPALTKDELIIQADLKIEQMMVKAYQNITLLQDALDLGIATNEELAQLKEWKIYRVMLSRVDTSTAPDIDLPDNPM